MWTRLTYLLLAEIFGYVPKITEPLPKHVIAVPVEVTEWYRQSGTAADVDAIWVMFDYEDISEPLKKWKYHRDESAWLLLEPGYRDALSKLSNMGKASVIPMPIGVDRWYERRFNQSDLLSNIVAETLELSGFRHLYRFWSGEHQARLSRDGRLGRKVSFWIPPRLRVPKRVVLVDDVISTGTTVNAAAAYLKSRGCQHVSVLALARSGSS